LGQTQLLLVLLGTILIGLAVYVGITMFSANQEEANRNAIIHDLQNFSASAFVYYNKPVVQGGGGKSFSNLTIRQVFPMVENDNARYSIQSATQNDCVIYGVGRVTASDGDSVRVRIRVTTQRNFVEILN
jgi:hypothetical protein